MRRFQWSRETWILICLTAVALAVRLYQIGWGLPYVYEEATPLKKAWVMWEWGSPQGVDLNPHFFNYPSLTIYLQFVAQGFLFILMKIAGVVADGVDYHARYIVDPTPVYYGGRLISVLFGAGTVTLTYLLGCRIFRRAGLVHGTVAAALVALNTFFISRSHMIEVDVPLTFFVVLVFWLLLRTIDRPSLVRFIVSGAAIGLAASTKYTGAMLLLPFIVVCFITRPGWRYPATAVATAAAAFALTSPYVFLDFGTFSNHLRFEREHMQIGHFGLGDTSSWVYYTKALTGRLIGWPAAVLALAGLVYTTLMQRRKPALVMAAFLVPYLIAVSTWSMHAERYLLPVLPALLLFAVLAAGELLERVPVFNVSPLARKSALVFLIAVLVVPAVAGYPAYLRTIRYDSRTFSADWIESNLPSGSYLVIEPYGPQVFKPQDVSQVNSRIRAKVLERKKDSRQFAVLPMPMFQVLPERSEMYYDISLYENADYFITTGSVKNRYTVKPDLFARQVAFYDTLEATCTKIAEVSPGHGGGSTITVYKNPHNITPFSARKKVAPPRPLRPVGKTFPGSEELYYHNVGLNYEVFSFLREAVASYDMAFRYPVTRPASFKNLVLRKTQCLIALDELENAVKYLGEMIPRSPTMAIRNQLVKLKGVIERRIAS